MHGDGTGSRECSGFEVERRAFVVWRIFWQGAPILAEGSYNSVLQVEGVRVIKAVPVEEY